MLSILIIKLIATALVVILVSVAVGKLGPRLGGIIAGTPIVLGPGYFFMLQDWPADFIASAALATLHALMATLLFSLCFVLTAKRFSGVVSLGLATLCWIPAAYLFTYLPGGVTLAVLSYLVLLWVADTIRRALALQHLAVATTSGWADLILRGLLAGILVSIATTLAAYSGPDLSGLLIGFPVGLLTIGWTLYDRYGADVARATIAAAQKGMLSLVAFAATTALAVGQLPPMAVFFCALGTSLTVSASLFLVSQWRMRQKMALSD